MLVFAPLLLAAITADPAIGRVVHPRGAGKWTCATAFLPENRPSTENWIAGFWGAWDMAQITNSEPLAGYSDLNGIVGEVEKICKEKPSSSLTFATLEARRAVKAREVGPSNVAQ
jgi:hypothetical protein